MEKRDLAIKVLEDLGLRPELDDDGDVTFRYQMKRIFAVMGDEDNKYIVLVLPQFFEVEEGEEHLAFMVCNKLTRELKLMKVYVDHTLKSVSANCEFFYTDEESLKCNVEYSLKLMGVIKSLFRKHREELMDI